MISSLGFTCLHLFSLRVCRWEGKYHICCCSLWVTYFTLVGCVCYLTWGSDDIAGRILMIFISKITLIIISNDLLCKLCMIARSKTTFHHKCVKIIFYHVVTLSETLDRGFFKHLFYLCYTENPIASSSMRRMYSNSP